MKEFVKEYIKACLDNISEDDSRLVFYRGMHKKYDDPYKPSIYHYPELLENEDKIFKEALSSFPAELLAQRFTIEKLILMQHYGFPTRIMDITKNPLIALFFACFSDNKKSEDSGRVYRFKVPEEEIKYCDSDTVSVIANLCKRPSDFSVWNTRSREKFNEREVIQHLVHDIREEKPHFQNLVEKNDIESVVCLRPRMNNPRIIRQDGYFFLFGIKGEKKHHAEIKNEWIDEEIYVPEDAKKEILNELNKLNINEPFVFPEYEHVAKYLKKKYSDFKH